jgi:hypothetical protein
MTGYLERILDDGTDRDRWLASRQWVVGASDAAKLSKIDSLDSYFNSKIKASSFRGNEKTESGHTWEPLMLSWAGVAENKALIHAPDLPGVGATPDGLGLRDGLLTLAECKAKHEKIVTGPTVGEWRQLAHQLYCVPEAEGVEFIWVELVRDHNGVYQIRKANGEEPKSLYIPRDDPRIVAATAQILPIVLALNARLQEARRFEEAA